MRLNIKVILILTIIISIVFIFFNLRHTDNLAKHTPADVTVYFHSYPHFINNLLLKYPQFSQQLDQFQNIDDQIVYNALKYAKKEVSIYHTPSNNWQIVTFYNKELENYLIKNSIPYHLDRKILYFPQKDDNYSQNITNRLSDNTSFKPKKLNFSQAYFYSAGTEALFVPAYIEYNYIEPFFAYFTTKNDFFRLTSSFTSNIFYQEKNPTYFNLEKFDFHAKNTDFSKLPLTASLNKNNFTYKLAQKLGKIDEFVKNDSQFIIVLDPKKITFLQTENIIKEQLAMLLPQEEEKTLPDGSLAIHLVAKPEDWEFQTINNTKTIEIPELDLSLQFQEFNNKIVLTNNYEIKNLDQNNIQQEKSCSNSNSYIEITNNVLDEIGIDSITISPYKALYTSFCIQ